MRAAAALNFLSAWKLAALFFHCSESRDFKASGSLTSSSPENGKASVMDEGLGLEDEAPAEHHPAGSLSERPWLALGSLHSCRERGLISLHGLPRA